MADLPTQNPYPFIYLKCQKGIFRDEHPCWGHSREYPPPPGGWLLYFCSAPEECPLFIPFLGLLCDFVHLLETTRNKSRRILCFSVSWVSYSLDCLQLPRLSQSPSLLISGSVSWPRAFTLLFHFTAENIKNYRSCFALVKKLELNW